ncbi:MAG: hypothetical protein Ta2A_26080 [Treponemataceae bacterium]|nr:MAG: hypothetical protein Ta2A_26080 [Treponemataceae bacterium]
METKNIHVLCAMLLAVCVPVGAQSAAAKVPVLTLDFTNIAGSATNQYAVWLEDVSGQFIKTVFVTDFTGRKGGWKKRPQSLVRWQKQADVKSLSKKAIDAVSGATPRTGPATYRIPLTDATGEKLPAGIYRICVEGTFRVQHSVLYTINVDTYEYPDGKLMLLLPEYSSREASLMPEANMLRNVGLKH